jgi:hypothetical protein
MADERTFRRGLLVGSLVVGVFALVDLALPFTGDQSLFAVAASGIAGGDVYYRDIWDIKQPGIYHFYAVSGALFGYGEVGIHLGELILLGALSLATARRLRAAGAGPVVAVAVPVALVGTYYATTSAADLTLLEIQVSAVGLLAAAIVARLVVGDEPGDPVPRRSVVLVGVLLAAIASLKLIATLPVLGALLAVAVVGRGRRWAIGRRGATALWLPAGAVALAITAAWFAWLASQAGFEELVDTTFVDPRAISALPGLHTADLAVDLVKGALLRFGPLLPLVLVGLRWRARLPVLEALRVAAIVWSVLAAVAVAGQKWNVYQVNLLAAPVAVLAVLGGNELVVAWRNPDRRPRWPLLVAAAVVVGGLWPGAKFADRAVDLASSDLALTAEGRFEYRVRQHPRYLELRAQLSEAGEGADGSPLYVMGDPGMHQASGRPIAIAMNGWSPEFFLARKGLGAPDELAAALPCDLFIDEPSQRSIDAAGQVFQELIDDAYRVRTTVDGVTPGTWYAADRCG